MNDSDKTIHIAPPKYIEWAAVTVLGVLALFLLVATLNGFENIGRSNTPAMNTITVSGEGKVSRVPDVAHITFTVQNTAATVAAAQEKTTKQTNAAIEYVKGQGIPAKDIKTPSYAISPQYSYPNPCREGVACPAYYENSPKITGYQVSQTVEVKLRGEHLDKISTLLAGLGSQNVQNLYGPNFTLDDPHAPQNEARGEAIADAKAQAAVLAKQLGVRLVRVVNFSEGGQYPVFYAKSASLGMGGDAEMSAPAPQIPAGENEYVSSVSITYEIR
jgi:uncharacterized protein